YFAVQTFGSDVLTYSAVTLLGASRREYSEPTHAETTPGLESLPSAIVLGSPGPNKWQSWPTPFNPWPSMWPLVPRAGFPIFCATVSPSRRRDAQNCRGRLVTLAARITAQLLA